MQLPHDETAAGFLLTRYQLLGIVYHCINISLGIGIKYVF